MTMRSRPLLLLPFLLLALPAFPFSCNVVANDIKYDLSPLSGPRSASRNTQTPPTTSEARVLMDLCSDQGIKKEEKVADEDQCPEHTRVCLKIVNRKDGAEPHARVTSVIPLWKTDTPDDHVWTHAHGEQGKNGLRIFVQGAEYGGSMPFLNFTLICDKSATEANPRLISYQAHPSRLHLEWASPDACPRSGSIFDGIGGGNSNSGGGGSSTGGGVGFGGLLGTLFWIFMIGLFLYFAVGVFYQRQQYSARGWDLMPHRDFWREFPVLLQDLFSHLFASMRGGGGRGAYSSLG